MTIHPSITIERVEDACEIRDNTLENPGFCVACGADAGGCEPDAQRYTCEVCGQATVYGAEELAMMLF